MIIFETERLLVRQYAADEFENFFRLNGDAEVVCYIRPVQAREEAMDSFQKVLAAYEEQPGLGHWAAHLKTTGEFAGSFAIIPLRWDKEKIQLGYAFPKENWGRGYATELTRKGLLHFQDRFSLNEIYGVTEQPHIVSQKVLLKAGFIFSHNFIHEGADLNIYVFPFDNPGGPNTMNSGD